MAKNQPWTPGWKNRRKFQFLIGWLKTFILDSDLGHQGGFQFLIGWLKTSGAPSGALKSPWFQFLIGWLKTSFRVAPHREGCFVSIPHRMAKNISGKSVFASSS